MDSVLKYFLILSFFSSKFLYSQTIISGVISDKINNNPIEVSIGLKSTTGKIIAFTNSNALGEFNMRVNFVGEVQIIFNALSYEKQSVTIDLQNKPIQFKIEMVTKSEEIEEIIIKTPSDIRVEQDSIIFKAKKFLQGNEQTIEDLLKKIPGLSVSADGTIKVGNQEVESVMVDGDDMFEKGYKILTKNMPVNPVEDVQVLKHFSNNKHLKGIENSEKVAINLTLKDEAKSVWFGNTTAGYGLFSENRYEFKGNLMNFDKTNKHYFLTNLNNIGFDATGDIDNLIRPVRFGEPGSIGDNQSAKTILSLDAGLLNFKKQRVNLNNSEMLSLNSIFTVSHKLKIKTLGFLNSDENDFFKNSLQQFKLDNTNFTNTENYIGRKTQITGFGKLEVIYDISKTKTLEIISKFNSTKQTNNSNLLFNSNLLNENLNQNNQLIDQKMVFTNKLMSNKVLVFSARYINEKTPQNYSVNQFLFNDMFDVSANNTKQNSQNKMQFAGFESHLLEKKKNGDLLELKLGNQLKIDNLLTNFDIFNDEVLINSPVNFQNDISYVNNNLYLNVKYVFDFSFFKLNAQSDFHQLYNELGIISEKSTNKPFFIIPKIGLEWEINSKNKLITSYSYNTTNPGVLDLYNGYVQTDFRNFEKGLNKLHLFSENNLFLNYNFGNWGDKFFSNTFIVYAKSNDFYSTNSMITQNYTSLDKIIIKDREFLSVSTNIDNYLKFLKSNFKVSLSGSKTNFKNIINNTNLREVVNLNTTYGFELRSGFRGFFNYHFGSKWNYNQVKTTIENDFTNNVSFLDLSFIISDEFNIQAQTERYFFGNLDNRTNKYFFCDLEASYVLKPNRLTFFLTGNNLFNIKMFKNYSISDTTISQTEVRLQPRYLLLKAEYRF